MEVEDQINSVDGQIDEEKKKIQKLHEETIHRDVKIVHKKLKKEGRIGITMQEIRNVIKECKICNTYNIKTREQYKHVEAH